MNQEPKHFCQQEEEIEITNKLAALIVQNLVEEDLGVYVWCKDAPGECLVKLVYEGILARKAVPPSLLFYTDWVEVAANPEVALELQRIHSL